jgi:hypothetical protein
MRFEFTIEHEGRGYKFIIYDLSTDEKEGAMSEARTIVELFPHRKADSYFKNLKELLEFRK